MISPPAKVLSRSDLDAIVTKLSRPHKNTSAAVVSFHDPSAIRPDIDAARCCTSRYMTSPAGDRYREDLQREDKCEGVGYECICSVRKGFRENFGTEGKTWPKDKVGDLEQLLTIRDA